MEKFPDFNEGGPLETKILDMLDAAAQALKMTSPWDGRDTLAKNPAGKKWKKRDPENLKGLVWHQELGWGSVENVAKYHTGQQSHLHDGGVESIAYTLAIRRNGQIVLCNDLNKAPWSQGFKGRKGDENAQFMSVMFEGFFNGEKVTEPSAGQPSDQQMLSGLILWQVCRHLWQWQGSDLYGHFLFGKPACPGTTLQTIVEAVRMNAAQPKKKFNSPKSRQQALQGLGYYSGKIDGKWGPGSKSALTNFQSDHHLSADGVWGPNTEAAILLALEK